MSKYSGLLFYFESENQAIAFEESLDNGWKYSDTISEAGFKVKSVEILLVSRNKECVDYVILAARNRKVSSRKFRYDFTKIFKLSRPIKFDRISNELDKKYSIQFLKKATGFTERIPEKTWIATIEIIKKIASGSSNGIDDIVNEREELENNKSRGDRVQILAHEKDAITLSLKLSGFDHTVIKDWRASNNQAPFLSGLPEARIGEDLMISHDQKIFGDWFRTDEFRVGTVSFTKDDEKITILNVNRQNLEHALGVDLVYYHHKSDSYVFIQYKRMLKNDSDKKYAYRPIDQSYQTEIKKILEFEKWRSSQTDSKPESPEAYRYNKDIFYFKLCPDATFNPLSSDLIDGMYLPLEYWNNLMNSDSTTGPNGGKLITYDNVGRYFIGAAFLNLVKSGMIGSRLVESKALNEIIRSSLADGKSVFLTKVEKILRTGR